MAQYRCPNCNSEFVFVEVAAWAKLIQIDHNHPGQRTETRTEIEPSERLRWNSDSIMKCASKSCGYTDRACAFDGGRRNKVAPHEPHDQFNRETRERIMLRFLEGYGYGGGTEAFRQNFQNQVSREMLDQIRNEGTATGRLINYQNIPRASDSFVGTRRRLGGWSAWLQTAEESPPVPQRPPLDEKHE